MVYCSTSLYTSWRPPTRDLWAAAQNILYSMPRHTALLQKYQLTGRWCKQCQLPKPPRAHHCKSCGKCVLKLDHHCPW